MEKKTKAGEIANDDIRSNYSNLGDRYGTKNVLITINLIRRHNQIDCVVLFFLSSLTIPITPQKFL